MNPHQNLTSHSTSMARHVTADYPMFEKWDKLLIINTPCKYCVWWMTEKRMSQTIWHILAILRSSAVTTMGFLLSPLCKNLFLWSVEILSRPAHHGTELLSASKRSFTCTPYATYFTNTHGEDYAIPQCSCIVSCEIPTWPSTFVHQIICPITSIPHSPA